MAVSPEILARVSAAQGVVMAQTELMHREFGKAKSMWKSDGTRVTPVDIAISEAIVQELQGAFPNDEFYSEELAKVDAPIPLGSRFSWVLDPIDGTNNYAMGLAHCAISLALLENGTPIYGVVYDLSRRVLMHGGPGHGLWNGDRPAQVRTSGLEGQSMIGFHTPYDLRFAHDAQILVENVKIRGLGSSTLHLAYVAAGILDGTVDHNVKVWDIAAAVALCWAGGGEVQFISPSPFPMKTFDLKMARIFYVAGNTAVCGALRKLLGQEATN